MRFRAWSTEHGGSLEDGRLIEAYSHSQAAELWADWFDFNTNDYLIVGGQTTTVCVQEENDSRKETFLVNGATERVYRATRQG